MAKTYKYTIETSAAVFPRHLADMLTDRFFQNHLVSVTDLQRSDHVYGATYQVKDEQDLAAEPTIQKDPEASVTLQFALALPCTTEDCPNTATIGNASYDPGQNAWVLFPLCKSCLQGLIEKYGVEEGEEDDEESEGDGSGLHQCSWCYDQVTEGHEEFCRLNPNRNRNIVP